MTQTTNDLFHVRITSSDKSGYEYTVEWSNGDGASGCATTFEEVQERVSAIIKTRNLNAETTNESPILLGTAGVLLIVSLGILISEGIGRLIGDPLYIYDYALPPTLAAMFLGLVAKGNNK